MTISLVERQGPDIHVLALTLGPLRPRESMKTGSPGLRHPVDGANPVPFVRIGVSDSLCDNACRSHEVSCHVDTRGRIQWCRYSCRGVLYPRKRGRGCWGVLGYRVYLKQGHRGDILYILNALSSVGVISRTNVSVNPCLHNLDHVLWCVT